MLSLPPDFKELLLLLNANSVEYVIVGGYAVAYHGFPRFTGDIDLLFIIKAENAKNIIKSLEQFGFQGIGLSESDFLSENQVIQLGVHPLRIDMLTSLSGVNNDEVFSNAEEIIYEGLSLKIISKSHLIANKKSTGRSKDLLDIEELNKA